MKSCSSHVCSSPLPEPSKILDRLQTTERLAMEFTLESKGEMRSAIEVNRDFEGVWSERE